MKNIYIVTVFLLSTALIFCGCVKQEAMPQEETVIMDSSPDEEEPSEQIVEKPIVLKVGIAMGALETEYQTGLLGGAIEKCNEMNMDYVYTCANSDAAKQSLQISSMISQGCNAILALPADMEKILVSAQECSDNDVLFAVFNRIPADITNVDIACGFDVKSEAYACGQAIVDAAAAAGLESIRCIEIVGPLTDKTVTERKDYFEEFALTNDIEIVYIVNAGEWNISSTVTGLADANEMLAGDYNAIYCPSDVLFKACEGFFMQTERLIPVGEEGHVITVGIGGSSEGLEYLRKGMADYVCDVDPMKLGRQTAACIYDALVNGVVFDTVQIIDLQGVTCQNASDAALWGNIDVAM